MVTEGISTVRKNERKGGSATSLNSAHSILGNSTVAIAKCQMDLENAVSRGLAADMLTEKEGIGNGTM